MSALDEAVLLAGPPVRLRQPAVWIALLALVLLTTGLVALALPDSVSGPVVWSLDAQNSLHQAKAIGLAMMAAGSGLVWLLTLIWQWRRPR